MTVLAAEEAGTAATAAGAGSRGAAAAKGAGKTQAQRHREQIDAIKAKRKPQPQTQPEPAAEKPAKKGGVTDALKEGAPGEAKWAAGKASAPARAVLGAPVRVADAGGGFLLGLMTWALALAYLRGGPAEVRKLLAAKFLNKVS